MRLFIVGHGYQLNKDAEVARKNKLKIYDPDAPLVQPVKGRHYQPNPNLFFHLPDGINVHFYVKEGCSYEEQWDFSIRRHVLEDYPLPARQYAANSEWLGTPLICHAGEPCPNLVLSRPGRLRTLEKYFKMKAIGVDYSNGLANDVTLPALVDGDTLTIKQAGKGIGGEFDRYTNALPWYTYLENIVGAIAEQLPVGQRPIDIHWCACRAYDNPLEATCISIDDDAYNDSVQDQAQDSIRAFLKPEEEKSLFKDRLTAAELLTVQERVRNHVELRTPFVTLSGYKKLDKMIGNQTVQAYLSEFLENFEIEVDRKNAILDISGT